MSAQAEILTEMKNTLADLKVQVGRDMPQFDKLAANIKALEQPAEHHGEATKAVAAPAPAHASTPPKWTGSTPTASPTTTPAKKK